MADLETVRVKSGKDFAIINLDDFDPAKHEPFDDDDKALVEGHTKDELRAADEAQRQLNANRGVMRDPGGQAMARNPSGTYSEPTPTDIRYPDKDTTEFENNHGAFVAKSAPEMRHAKNLPDAPGGLQPDPKFVPGTPGATTKAAKKTA
jgi:hypothetical protein